MNAKWVHVNGIPVLARTKTAAVRLFHQGRLVRLYTTEDEQLIQELRYVPPHLIDECPVPQGQPKGRRK